MPIFQIFSDISSAREETGIFVKQMLKDLKLPTLQERRKQLRLIFMDKMVEGLVPAMPSSQFFTPKNTSKRQIKAKKFDNCESSNIVNRSATHNSRPFVIPRSPTDQFRHSFFVQTVLEWNHLNNNTMTASSIDNFKKMISPSD